VRALAVHWECIGSALGVLWEVALGASLGVQEHPHPSRAGESLTTWLSPATPCRTPTRVRIERGGYSPRGCPLPRPAARGRWTPPGPLSHVHIHDVHTRLHQGRKRGRGTVNTVIQAHATAAWGLWLQDAGSDSVAMGCIPPQNPLLWGVSPGGGRGRGAGRGGGTSTEALSQGEGVQQVEGEEGVRRTSTTGLNLLRNQGASLGTTIRG